MTVRVIYNNNKIDTFNDVRRVESWATCIDLTFEGHTLTLPRDTFVYFTVE